MTVVGCAVCFGASDAPMAIATNLGIFMMLGVVAGMLASFGAFIVYLNRRAKMTEAGGSVDEAGSRARPAGSHIDLEGTARC
jgi:hypothetical protein